MPQCLDIPRAPLAPALRKYRRDKITSAAFNSEILITLSLTLYPRPQISLMDSDILQISSGAMASEVVSLVAQVRTQKSLRQGNTRPTSSH